MRYKFSVRCPSTETWISIREVEWDNLRTFGHCGLNHAMFSALWLCSSNALKFNLNHVNISAQINWRISNIYGREAGT